MVFKKSNYLEQIKVGEGRKKVGRKCPNIKKAGLTVCHNPALSLDCRLFLEFLSIYLNISKLPIQITAYG